MIKNKMTLYLGLCLLCGLVLYCYGDVLQWMYNRYVNADSYYSHGFFIPFVSLYLIWLKREKLLGIEAEYSRAGLVLVCLSLLLHIIGTVVYIYSISGFSLFFLIIGLTLFLFGLPVAKTIAFPLLFLVFMFPLPMAVISMISFPLKMLAAKSAVWLVSLLGIPILREGFHISIPAGDLLVGNPCSGLRSLISFLALGAVFAYMTSLSTARKWLLFLLSVPIALLVNIVRVAILILVSQYWGLEAAAPETMVHVGSGLVIFVLGILLLLLGAKVLE